MQNELPLLGLLRSPAPLLEHQLLAFGDEEEKAVKAAVQWAWRHRRIQDMDQRTAAMHIGIQAPHFSNILNGKKHLPPHKINRFEQVCGNRALSMTIERFRLIRERELITGLAIVVAENMVRNRA